MITVPATYPIGTAGQPWGTAEREEWRSRQSERSYVVDVLAVLERLRSRFDVVQYGELDYAPDRYSLFAIKSRDWRDDLAVALVTGGVHGYETSGVHGALQFVERHGTDYAGRINLLVIPCVSPWGYERNHRWNPYAVDPNRSFREPSEAEESAAVIRRVGKTKGVGARAAGPRSGGDGGWSAGERGARIPLDRPGALAFRWE